MKYLGADANKVLAYGVASVSGTILAVCSCTVLPLFAGIYRMGAGLGPGDGVSLLRTGDQRARDRPDRPGAGARAGHRTGRRRDRLQRRHRSADALDLPREEKEKAAAQCALPEARSHVRCGRTPSTSRPWSWFSSSPTGASPRRTRPVARDLTAKWHLTALGDRPRPSMLVAGSASSWWKIGSCRRCRGCSGLALSSTPRADDLVAVHGLVDRHQPGQGEAGEWFTPPGASPSRSCPCSSLAYWSPGRFLADPGHEGLIPAEWVSRPWAAIPWGQPLCLGRRGLHVFRHPHRGAHPPGAHRQRHGQGPRPGAPSGRSRPVLPNMLVIPSVMGTKKTVVFVSLVVVMATISGMVYGTLFA